MWCIDFVWVPNSKGKVRLWLDPSRLISGFNQTSPLGPKTVDIFPHQNTHCLTPKDATSRYHNLKLDVQYSYLTIITFQSGRYRYARLPFGATQAGDMFKRKLDELFKELSNVFGIEDDIPVARYDKDDIDHDDLLRRVLKISRQESITLNISAI